jgi:hypothetical protein
MDSPLLSGWDNFYVIVGSAAGGLTGLTFVVIALISDARRVRPAGIAGFVTPTIVHFCSVLGLAAYMAIPHQGVLTLSLGLAAGGIAGIVYGASIQQKIGGQSPEYTPVVEDWAFNVILPMLSYLGLVALAALLWSHPAAALYGVALVALVLLFVGIHNAWDIAVWMTLSRDREAKKTESTQQPPK